VATCPTEDDPRSVSKHATSFINVNTNQHVSDGNKSIHHYQQQGISQFLASDIFMGLVSPFILG
jgi:hypothetical protein